MIRLLTGDCRETLQTLEPCSVQSVITSPPYYSLRDYGTDPLVWGGDAGHEHDWNDEMLSIDNRTTAGLNVRKGRPGNGTWDQPRSSAITRSSCSCGAWLGNLGLEPTPDCGKAASSSTDTGRCGACFVCHLVEVFRHVRRVLRDDGVLWLNLGDSYAGSPAPSRGHGPHSQLHAKGRQGQQAARLAPPDGLKPKDLMMIPFRAAMALQADGWYIRSVIPWAKGSAMPESVRDRPSTSIEYVFLLSKRGTYYWDPDAIRVKASEQTHSRGNGTGRKNPTIPFGAGNRNNEDFTSRINGHVAERNRRNGDWLMESLQGLLLDEQDDPLALVVNPAPFTGSHFATFPVKLVEPMIKASTKPDDTVLDPFGGAGTVGLVADRLQRNAILCELRDGYADMASARIVGDAPLFAEVDGGGNSVQPIDAVQDKQAALGKHTYTGFNARWDAKEVAVLEVKQP